MHLVLPLFILKISVWILVESIQFDVSGVAEVWEALESDMQIRGISGGTCVDEWN